VFKGKYFIGKKGFKGVASDSSIKQLARERGAAERESLFLLTARYRGEGLLDGGREYDNLKFSGCVVNLC